MGGETGTARRDGALFEASATGRTVVHWEGATATDRPDTLAPEEPLEIRLAGRPLTVTMRTPGHDDELAVGLLYAQELVRAAADVGAIVCDPAQPNRLDVQLSTALDGEERWRRYTYA